MATFNQESWNDRSNEFENNNSQVLETDVPKHDYNLDDEDDQNLKDDDLRGRDLDSDSSDEWDADDMNETDLDEDDLADNDEANADLHNVKNDKFGSLASSIQNGPDPDETPEEQVDGEEVDYPDDDDLEEGSDDEVNYKETTEVSQPNVEEGEQKVAALNKLDPTFVDDSHERQNKRMVDHEPGAGSTTGEHGAYNL